MKIEKLTEGMLIKNYKELCALLDLPVRNGKSKRLQLEDLARFVQLEKQGNKFLVKEIYEMAKPKIDKRTLPGKTGNNALYSKDIQALIIDYLAKQKDYCCFLSINAFLKELEMINKNYVTGKKHVFKLSELTKIPVEVCYDYFNTTQVRLKEKLETALKGLRNRALIIWTPDIAVCARVLKEKPEINELSDIKLKDRDSLNLSVAVEYRAATKEEKELIVSVENMVLKDMGLMSLQDAFYTGQWKAFKKKVNKYLLDEANIEFYYNAYNVVFNKENIAEAQRLQASERKTIKSNLNGNIHNMLNTNAATINKRVNGYDTLSKGEYIQSIPEYVEYTETLNNTLIKSDARSIVGSLKKPLKGNQISLFDIKRDINEDDDLPF